MSSTTSEILRSYFFSGADVPAGGHIRVDVLDSWTNSGLAAVSPTTITWSDGRSLVSDGNTAS